VQIPCLILENKIIVGSQLRALRFCSRHVIWLVWSGLVWSGLVWSGLVWSGLVWFEEVLKKY
jgi:hypothetical protein